MTDFLPRIERVGEIKKHPGADTLGITEVQGCPVIVKLGQFTKGDLAAYIPVDAIVDGNRPEFEFLGRDKKHRIRAKKLRGVFSMGMLVSAPYGAVLGAAYPVDKYVPPMEREPQEAKHALTRKAKHNELKKFEQQAYAVGVGVALGWAYAGIQTGNLVAGVLTAGLSILTAYGAVLWNRARNRKPNVPVYDIEGLRRYKDVFQTGEPVWLTEKIHGCSCRYVYTGSKLHIGSRTMFRNDDNNVWAQAAKKYDLAKKLKTIPGIVVFGEVFGPTCQDLHYGIASDDVGFMAFDAMNIKTRKYLDVNEFRSLMTKLNIRVVPTLYEGAWKPELIALAEGKSTLDPSHVREGFVIKPMVERQTPGLGRTFLKMVGSDYYLRKEA